MSDIIIDNISLIVLTPLWIFLIIMGGRFFSVYVNKFIIYVLTLFASFSGVIVCALGLKYINQTVEWSMPFLKIQDFSIYFGIHVDRLSLIFALLLFSISFCVQLFSISYMQKEKKQYRFFALLNLFNFAMSALLFSQNLYQLYVFWEVVGIASYLLIGFDYSKETKSNAAKRVFLTNRTGDTALIVGIVLTTYIMYNFAGNLSFTTLSFLDFNAISTMLMAYTTTPVFLTICGLFIMGAMVKSAQFPFHIWLQDAMEAKVPVSALLHSATMVAAGVYLIIRLLPFFTLSPYLMKTIAVIGILTALICSIFASIETHPKKVLAYSTSANLGLMFLALGLGNVKAALIFLSAHALIKSMLFLSLPREDKKVSNVGFCIFIIGALSLAGLVFAGFSAKEYLYEIILNPIVKTGFLLVSFLSAFYILRLVFLIYKERVVDKLKPLELIACILFLLANIGLCYLLKGISISYPFAVGIVAALLVYILNKLNLLTRLNTTPKITEKFIYEFIPIVYEKISLIADKIDKNVFSNYKPFINFAKMNVKLAGWIEENIMNRTVTLTTDFAKLISKQDLVLQSGNVQTYNAYAFIFVTIIVTLVIIGYTFIITTFGG